MDVETVTIGCRLPHGYVLEVGYEVVTREGNSTRTQLQRKSNYARYTLKGTNQTAFIDSGGGNLVRLPSRLAPEPFINRDVPKAVWEEWIKTHGKDWVVASGNIFEVKGGRDAANVKAAVVDAMAKPAILTPMDPSKPMVFGQNSVETADFMKDRA